MTFKRFLAYSSIANMGYVLLGLCSGSFFGVVAAIYYFMIYIMISINFFSIFFIIRRYSNFRKFRNLVDLASISHSNYLLSLYLALCILSLAGIPPLIGFFGKFMIIFSLIHQEYYFLALFAVIFSVFTCVYYIRLVRFLLFTDAHKFPKTFLAPIPYRHLFLFLF